MPVYNQGVGGALQKIAQVATAGSAVGALTISGLDGNAQEQYFVVVEGTTSDELRFRWNTTEEFASTILYGNGTNALSGSANYSVVGGAAATSSVVTAAIDVYAKTARKRIISRHTRNGVCEMLTAPTFAGDTTTNITALTIATPAGNNIEHPTRMTVYRVTA